MWIMVSESVMKLGQLVVRFIEDNSLAMRRKDGTFEEDIECIVEPKQGRGGIFISNLEAAQNPATLHKHHIGAVITAARGQNLASTLPKHIEYLYLPAIDHESFHIAQYFDDACALLSQELQRTNVLVHCMAGVSRSATLVIAFLMRSQRLSFDEAFRLVKSKRKIVLLSVTQINPNSAFIQQLQKEEKRLSVPSSPTRDKKAFQQSTSSSWFSPEPRLKEDSGGEGMYDQQLRQRIRVLFKRVRK